MALNGKLELGLQRIPPKSQLGLGLHQQIPVWAAPLEPVLHWDDDIQPLPLICEGEFLITNID